jgi:protein farnesyltransferase subunit beta
MLRPFLPDDSPSKPSLNFKTLLRWLTHMQGTEIELGGFKGRTNKLVDGCYSWWIGGSFALLDALGVGPSRDEEPMEVEHDSSQEVNDEWNDVDGQQKYVSILFFSHLGT